MSKIRKMHKKPKDFPLTIIFDKENQQILTFKQLEPANVRFIFPCMSCRVVALHFIIGDGVLGWGSEVCVFSLKTCINRSLRLKWLLFTELSCFSHQFSFPLFTSLMSPLPCFLFCFPNSSPHSHPLCSASSSPSAGQTTGLCWWIWARRTAPHCCTLSCWRTRSCCTRSGPLCSPEWPRLWWL